jgi:hypothetical protein
MVVVFFIIQSSFLTHLLFLFPYLCFAESLRWLTFLLRCVMCKVGGRAPVWLISGCSGIREGKGEEQGKKGGRIA